MPRWQIAGQGMQGRTHVIDAIEVDSHGCLIGRFREFILRPAYQPIYSAVDRARVDLKGFEGLARPFHSGRQVTPEDFFRTVGPDDAAFVESLCMTLHILGYSQALPPDKALFINVNVASFQTIEMLESELYFAFSQLARAGLKNTEVIFEILENEIPEAGLLNRACQLFRSNGFRFAMDDFGTSFSNVERYLKVRPDFVKMDRELFQDFAWVPETGTLLRSLIRAFSENGAVILMEGLENREEVLLASQMGVDMMQGFQLGKPEFLPCEFPETLNVEEFQPRKETGTIFC